MEWAFRSLSVAVCGGFFLCAAAFVSGAVDEPLKLHLRSERLLESGGVERVVRDETWKPTETAIIVCDVWDVHHCLNAVRRLEEFAPRMNAVLIEARKRGVTIIHSPSDCMSAYEGHPARQRAIDAPVAKNKPKDVAYWCSRIPGEEAATYPIDQSDGGEDDDPAEHAEWVAKLKAMGRNPGTPWKTESKLIEIDAARDLISDRGDEVWNILESRGIKNVILVGVHLNMCVLGRPFGLRQMVRNGKNVALMRDMTDCMYNPKRWPRVDHFTGNDLMIRHVERYVCPTMTSDQFLGGKPFRSKYDTRVSVQLSPLVARSPGEEWSPISVPSPWSKTSAEFERITSPVWYRSVVRLPKEWVHCSGVRLSFVSGDGDFRAWLNGEALVEEQTEGTKRTVLRIPDKAIVIDDANLLVVHGGGREPSLGMHPPVMISGKNEFELKGGWQFLVDGDEAALSNMPLPAKFGGSTDIFFEVK